MAVPMMIFDPDSYGPEVALFLSVAGGVRPMPLVIEHCASEDARDLLRGTTAANLLPHAPAPQAALSGLWLYIDCFEESHGISQDIPSAEGSYWHGILHRREPDAGNAAYWLRRVGVHPVFRELHRAATAIVESGGVDLRLGSDWNPFAFIDFCEAARQRRGSREEEVARYIQLAEWQLLFDYCARSRHERNA
jgi:hypothetical protein